MSPIPFIGYPSSAIRVRRRLVTACAARAQSSNALANASERQSPVITENGLPVRTSALAWSWAPWIPWL